MASASIPGVTAMHGRASSALENKKLGLARRSTPDSEALVSSDDDHEPNSSMSKSLQSIKSVPAQRPVRRGSWLSEVRTAQRKYSLGGMSLASTNGNSQPPTPSAENGHPLEKVSSSGQGVSSSMSPWDALPGRNTGMATSPWATTGSQGTSSWSKKEGSRWSEVLSTSAHNSPMLEDLRSPRTVVAAETSPVISNTGFPFDIPLEPSRKTVRSQSYSAGQLEMSHGTDSAFAGRFKSKRAIPPSLARRKSRVTMDNGSEFDLAAVQEDPEMQIPQSTSGNATSSPYVERSRMTIRHPSTISLDNAELTRSMSYPLVEQFSDDRDPSGSINAAARAPSIYDSISATTAHTHDSFSTDEETQAQRILQNTAFPHQMADPFPPGPGHQNWSRESLERRPQPSFPDASTYPSSLHSYNQMVPSYAHPMQPSSQLHTPYDFANPAGLQPHQDNSRLYSTGRAMAGNQRTGGPAFAAVPDNLPENVVTQSIQNAALEAQSILAEGEQAANISVMDASSSRRAATELDRARMPYNSLSQIPSPRDNRRTSIDLTRHREFDPHDRDPAFAGLGSELDIPSQLHQGQHSQSASAFDSIYRRGIPTPDDMAELYATDDQQRTLSKSTRNLYLVTFKASRAEVFYRPAEFIGDLPEGHMVIVEGDRGLDMGMIAHVELDHDQAKALKAEYNRKHYHTLVRFSRNYPHLADSIVNDPDYEERAAQNLADQTLGALGTPSNRSANLSPKAIRRIATDREIMLLRDKEGNEARAKRICQGKVNTQHLSMEILDAEFQLDYRKLTFYFYAEEYIPFNAIVTDLFKVWKTRIWLSAVNPDTYPAPPRRPGDAGRQPRRDGRNNEPRRDQNYQAAASAARRAYIRGAQDLAMGQFPGALAATFQQNAYQQQQHQLQQQAAFSPPGQVVLPQAPFTGNRRQMHNNLTFGSMSPPSLHSSGNRPWGTATSIPPNANQPHMPHTHRNNGPGASPSLLRAAPAVADALASRGELPPAFVPGGQQHILPGLGDLSLHDRKHQHH